MLGCLSLDRLPLSCEYREHPDLRGRAVVVTRGRPPVVWVASDLAEQRGVVGGQLVREALGLCPQIDIVAGRPAQYSAILEELAGDLRAVVPGVTLRGYDEIYLDLKGLERRHPDLTVLGREIVAAIPEWLIPRLAIAHNAFITHLAAHRLAPGEVRFVEGVDVARLLGDEPIESLPADPRVHRRFRILGMRTIGDVARLPLSVMGSQLGPDGAIWWRMARGEAVEQVEWQQPHDRIAEHTRLEEPLSNLPTLLALAHRALGHLCAKPEFAGRAARQLQIRCVCEHAQEWKRSLTFKQAATGRDEMWAVARPALERATLPGPVLELHIEATEISNARGWQTDLSFDKRGRDERLDEGIRKLTAQFGGRSPVSQIVEVDTWNRVPERRRTLMERRSSTNRAP